MKTRIRVTELSHDDLVNLFSTALYGSSYLGADYEEAIEHDEEDCFEDILSKILLHGGVISVTDYEAEGEVYGTLPHEIDDAENVTYFVTYDDIVRGLERAANEGCAYSKEAFHIFRTGSLDFDLGYADALMQEIVFEEVIYG